jgi:acyl carrier protein
MENTEKIYALLRDALVELFELDPERITPDSNLYTDLEIDSIDAIDLIDHMKHVTGYKLAAEDFRSVRTVNDVVRAVVAQQERMA